VVIEHGGKQWVDSMIGSTANSPLALATQANLKAKRTKHFIPSTAQ